MAKIYSIDREHLRFRGNVTLVFRVLFWVCVLGVVGYMHFAWWTTAWL